MIKWDMVYVSYIGDFLCIGSRESFEQHILLRLSSGKKSLQAAKKSRPAAKQPAGPARPSFESRR